MENLGYLVAAYTIIFVAIFLYVVFIWRRQARLEAQLRLLERRVRSVRDEIAAHGTSDSRSASS
jgi:CcmD family protein